jgi:hypothetical protein
VRGLCDRESNKRSRTRLRDGLSISGNRGATVSKLLQRVQRLEQVFTPLLRPNLAALMTDEELERMADAWEQGALEAQRVWASMSQELLRRSSVAS